jgi:YidC/Oxa1 family membrane protein insertase
MGEYKRMLLAVVIASIFIYLWTSIVAKHPSRRPGGPISPADSALVADTTGAARHPIPPADQGRLPTSPQPKTPTTAPTTPVATPPSEGAESLALRGGWEAVPEWESEVVGTDLCKGVLVESGGGLSSWQLLDYLDQQDEPVNLINLGQGTASDLRLELVSGDALLSFDEVDYAKQEVEPPARVTEAGDTIETVIALTASDSSGAGIAKTYTFYRGHYYFDLDVKTSGFSSANGLSCALSWGYGLPITEANVRADVSNLAAISLLGDEFIKYKMGDFKKEPVRTEEGTVRWTGVRNKYFIAAMIPTGATGTAIRSWGSPDLELVASQLFVPMDIASDGAAVASFRIYAGPMDFERLRALNVGLEKDVYQRFKFMAPLNHLVFGLMKWTYGLVPNYGVVIILVSVLIKLIFYPLSRSSLRSMQAMKKVQPELEALKKKYKGDAKKMNQAQMELFRKHKVNPMGGCLPILVQMPIFFALYNVLVESVELRRAPFVGWINDLSAPDTLFHLGTFPVHLLPLIMAVTQLAQPTMGAASDPRQQMMKYVMPIFLLVIFYGLPSGLVLYWTVNNVMTALQQYMMNRSEKAGEDEVTVAPVKPGKRGRKGNNK